jgi:hypothetical protein
MQPIEIIHASTLPTFKIPKLHRSVESHTTSRPRMLTCYQEHQELRIRDANSYWPLDQKTDIWQM